MVNYVWLQYSNFVCVILDVYVFGIGNQVNKDQLNSLASQKRGEQHVFIVKDYGVLQEVFNSIISKLEIALNSKAQNHVFLPLILALNMSKLNWVFLGGLHYI